MTETACILVADDDSAIRTVISQALSRAGYDVRTSSTASGLWRWVASGEGKVVITDVVLPDESGFELIPRIRKVRPDLPIIVMSAQNTILTAITAAERGAFEYLPKPFDLNVLLTLVRRALADESVGTTGRGREKLEEEHLPLIGRSGAMQEVYRVVARLTLTDLTVMILGESGTGKELVARALHDYGRRKKGPFVAANMAAIPRDLVESDLFGHERGAFTGATSRGIGRFEQAEGGTLFLDEIGDMPPDAQTRLLRVLQEGEFTTVGGRTPVRSDVRIIAATNRDLRQMIAQGLFREDLYYRLNVVPLRLPPLRDRREDIPDLVLHFLRKTSVSDGLPSKRIGANALDLLMQYNWPGNVRELENLIRRLAVLCPGEEIDSAAVTIELHGQEKATGHSGDANETLAVAVERHLQHYFSDHAGRLPPAGLHARVLEAVERPLLAICLGATGGNQVQAAQILGLNRNTLRKRLRELGIGVKRTPTFD